MAGKRRHSSSATLTALQSLPKNIRDTRSKRPILEDFHSSLGKSEPPILSSSPFIYLSQATLAAGPSGPFI